MAGEDLESSNMVSATALILSRKDASFESRTVELARLRPGEVLVKLTATGMCRTDLKVQHGGIPFPFPAILGHEGAGIILNKGAEVYDLEKGDSVILAYNFCGSCHSCKTKRTWQCSNIITSNFGGCRDDGSRTVTSQVEGQPLGTSFFGQSSFCNPTIVQAVCCVKIDPRLPLSVVCTLGCGFQTGSGAVYHVVRPNARGTRSLAIFGMGGVGCAAVMMARYLAKQEGSALKSIIAIDINNQRLEFAKELGATHVVNSAELDLEDRLNEITSGEGIDAVIDCSGVAKVIEGMVKLLGPGGLAVSVGGLPPGSTVAFEAFDMLIHAKTYRGCHQGNAYSREFIPMLADLYDQGELPIERLQKTFRPDEINEAAEQMSKGLVVKPVIVWDM